MKNKATNLKVPKRLSPSQMRMDKIVGGKINFGEPELQSVAKAAGATWDKQAKLWRMPKCIATALNIEQRIREQ